VKNGIDMIVRNKKTQAISTVSAGLSRLFPFFIFFEPALDFINLFLFLFLSYPGHTLWLAIG
jgi:hypothetical protein